MAFVLLVLGALGVLAVRLAGRRFPGVWYRVLGRRPDPDVPDLVLADRVRSSLGPLHARLDVPRVHVLAYDHVVTLHGEVQWPHQAAAIEDAVRSVSGVRRVVSHVRVGLAPTDSRPSEGSARPAPPSNGMRHLIAAATAAGVEDPRAPAVVRDVLRAFLGRVPIGERRHVVDHLPTDVRSMLGPIRTRSEVTDLRTVDDLVRSVGSPDVVPPVVEAITAAVRELVPEEVADVGATLPADLRRCWAPPTVIPTGR